MTSLLRRTSWCVVSLTALAIGCEQRQSATSALATAAQSNQVSGEQKESVNAQAAEARSQDDAVIIPLREISALDMPETRKMSTAWRSTGEDEFEGGNLLRDIVQTALPSLKSDQKTGKGFAVVGTDLTAVQEAHRVLVNGQKRREELPANEPISIVFFSHQFSQYVHLEPVERNGYTIILPYHFVPHGEQVMTQHFAAIPLGTLLPGKYRVEVIRSAQEPKFNLYGVKPVDKGLESRVVCQSFEFSVK